MTTDKQIQILIKAFGNEFMRPDISKAPSDYWLVDGPQGACVVPADLVSDSPDIDELIDYCGEYHTSTKGCTFERKTGYLCRFSAPGYLDCTDWMVFETKEEILAWLQEAAGDICE